mgnify:CR=1 FL=1
MSDYYVYDGSLYPSNELQHHGIKGMHWGIRRYQNPDGTLTAEGSLRYRGKGLNLTSNQKKAVGAIAAASATKSVIDTIGNWKTANSYIKGFAKIPVSKLVTAGTVQAGKVAAVSALATVGFIKVGEVIKTKNKERYAHAADAAQRDADDLRKHGYLEEANAVQKVADKNRKKSSSTMKANTRSTASTEIDKLMSKSKALKSDFGGSSSMIDDPEYFEYVARTEYGLDTSELRKHLQKPSN